MHHHDHAGAGTAALAGRGGDLDSVYSGSGSGFSRHMHHSMAATFEMNAHVRLLIDGIESHTALQYAFVLCLLFMGGIFREFLSYSRRKKLLGAMDRGVIRKEAALRYTALYAYDMCLMLLIMSFNIGVFAAIVTGVGFGHYLFWDNKRVSSRAEEEEVEKLPCC